jgi:PncC family amidohydrolase
MFEWLEHGSARELITQVAQRLSQAKQKIVLAESCTGGLSAAMLASMPGISEWLVGSLVAYRVQSKIEWLNVPYAVASREAGVGQATSNAMAIAALEQSSEANWAAAITGHLGPNAPENMDGRIFVAVAARIDGQTTLVRSTNDALPPCTRQARQWSAAETLWRVVLESMEGEKG